MSSKLRTGFLLLAIIVFITMCTSALYMPTAHDAERLGTTIDTLRAGRRMYVDYCSSCHSLYLPEQYTRDDWSTIMDYMQERSKINEDQKEQILRYLETNSKKE